MEMTKMQKWKNSRLFCKYSMHSHLHCRERYCIHIVKERNPHNTDLSKLIVKIITMKDL